MDGARNTVGGRIGSVGSHGGDTMGSGSGSGLGLNLGKVR
jgi:hypothetical protein